MSGDGTTLLTIPQICDRLTISPATLRRWKARADFPRQVQLGPRRVGYLKSEVEAWVSSRYEAAVDAINRKHG